MTCYQRHLRPMFETLGVEYDREGRQNVDAAIRKVLVLADDVGCSEVWASIKALTPEEREHLTSRVAREL